MIQYKRFPLPLTWGSAPLVSEFVYRMRNHLRGRRIISAQGPGGALP